LLLSFGSGRCRTDGARVALPAAEEVVKGAGGRHAPTAEAAPHEVGVPVGDRVDLGIS
jgi:hypothetical protein